MIYINEGFHTKSRTWISRQQMRVYYSLNLLFPMDSTNSIEQTEFLHTDSTNTIYHDHPNECQASATLNVNDNWIHFYDTKTHSHEQTFISNDHILHRGQKGATER